MRVLGVFVVFARKESYVLKHHSLKQSATWVTYTTKIAATNATIAFLTTIEGCLTPIFCAGFAIIFLQLQWMLQYLQRQRFELRFDCHQPNKPPNVSRPAASKNGIEDRSAHSQHPIESFLATTYKSSKKPDAGVPISSPDAE